MTTRLSTFNSKAPIVGYLLECLLFLLLVVVVQCTAFMALPKDPFSYHKNLAGKIAQLKSCRGAKVVLVGGSNLAFGVDSERLQAALGEPVINTSHHAGLGLSFMLRVVDPWIKDGDTVVLSPEYELFFAIPWNGVETLCELLFEDPSLLPFIDREHIGTLVKYHHAVLSRRLLRLLGQNGQPTFIRNPIYNESACNTHGDVVTHLAADRPVAPIAEMTLPQGLFQGSPAVRRLAAITARWQARGAQVVLVPPCVRASDYERNHIWMQSLFSVLRSELSGVAPLSAGEAVLPDDKFFDTFYHLTAEGRVLRTSQLITALSGIRPHESPQGVPADGQLGGARPH